MQLFKIKFLPSGKKIKVSPDTDILRAAIKAKLSLYNSCGGRGLCGKCKVKIIEGKFTTAKTLYLTDSEKRQNYVLACQTYPLSDLIIEIPLESRISEGRILKGREFEVQEDLEETESLTDKKYPLEPLIKKISLDLPPPTNDDNLADFERIQRALSIRGEKQNSHNIQIPLFFLRKLPQNLRRWDWKLFLTYSPDINKIINLEPQTGELKNLGLACDIGTTTVVVYLIDLNSGKIISPKACYNRQITFGEDVISRIIISEEAKGLEELNTAVIDTINELIGDLISEYNLKPDQLNAIVLTGNATMLHLMLKVSPGFIRKSPFTPAFKSSLFFSADELGLRINPEAVAAIMPGIASFVGSDIISGILASGIDNENAPCIFIDLGTNGEVVLGNKEWMLCCSTSAGPCFEGGVLTSGIRAMKGAIQGFKIKEHTIVTETISDAKPAGICGTGIIEIIAELLLNKIIDRGGNFIPKSSPRLRVNKYEELEFLITSAEDTLNNIDIVVTQSDIKNLIYSKAAIYMGMEVLLNNVGLQWQDIGKIFIAGGLGTYLNIKKAIMIGLLPDLPLEKFVFLGNSSIQGARIYLISKKARERASELSQTVTNIELTNSLEFMNNYTSALFLPHTDLNKFPNLKNLFEK